MSYSITLPSWTAGENALEKVPEICAPYGKHAVIIGGRHACEALCPALKEACAGKISLFGPIWYGGEASVQNLEMLETISQVRGADMIFAVGGGKALDTGKALAHRLGKKVFTFPTIASTCAACTAVSILYKPDGSFDRPFFLPQPPAHAFIHLPVIASAPEKYLWAGLGDTYAKYFEATMSARGVELKHYHALGVGISAMCLEPLLKYGRTAMEDHRRGEVTPALEQTVLTVIVNTAAASILLTQEGIIDFNTGLAHAIYYALTSFPDLPVEKEHLHGEVVGFGTLALLLVDGQEEMYGTMKAFNESVALPTKIGDIGIKPEDLDRVLPRVLEMHDIDRSPYPITLPMLREAFRRLQ